MDASGLTSSGRTPRVALVNAITEEREVRRLSLLARRAAADWGAAHPEIREIAEVLEQTLLVEATDGFDPGDLMRRLESASAKRSDGPMYDVVRRDLIAELAELVEEIAHDR